MAYKLLSGLIFNTGRKYSAGGQEIIAFQAIKNDADQNCCVVFHDRARGIWGEIPPSVEFHKTAIMEKYDAGAYVATSPFDSKAAELSVFRGQDFKTRGYGEKHDG